MTDSEIFNWLIIFLGIGYLIYHYNKKDTVFVVVRDKNGKVHRILVYVTDSEEEVLRKVEDYMKKHQ